MRKMISLGLVTVLLSVIFSCIVPQMAFAVTEQNECTNDNFEILASENSVEPYALFVDVVVAIDGGNREVWSAAQTKAAIFATSIYVVLELYSSDTYQDSYQNMTLEKRVHSSNLKKGEIIKAVMPTNGVQKYWRGRMYYRADSADWKYGETNTWLFDPNGIVVL